MVAAPAVETLNINITSGKNFTEQFIWKIKSFIKSKDHYCHLLGVSLLTPPISNLGWILSEHQHNNMCRYQNKIKWMMNEVYYYCTIIFVHTFFVVNERFSNALFLMWPPTLWISDEVWSLIINSESAKICGVLAAACHQCHQCHQSPCDEFYQSEKRGPDIPDPDWCGINHFSRNYTSSHSSSRHRDADYSLSHQSSSAILLELRMKVCKDFTIIEKAPTRAFSWLKAY